MNEWNEHIEDEFPKVERTEVSFDNKDSLKRYAISDEEIKSHFQKEIKAIQFRAERKSNLKKKESNRATYFWISAMAAGWVIALVLRTFIVIPEKSAPEEYTYHRPEIEIEIEKKIDKRDTVYTVNGEWLLPWYENNLQHYCGGTNFPDMWSPAYGFGFPNGTMPWSSLVYLPPVDSAQSIPIQVNQDSVLVAKIDSSLQQMKSKKKTMEYLTIREFVAQEIDERIEKFRKVKRVLRAARNKNKENDEDRLVVDWKGRRFGF